MDYLRSKGVLLRGISGLSAATSASPATSGPCPRARPSSPGEPILTVRAPAIQAQFIETYVLLTLNHQSLIATKSNRIVRAAEGRPVSEFGSRRAQGADGALLGARASLHRRLRRHRLRPGRPDVRLPRRRHHGPLLGADVPRRVHRLQDLLPALSPLRHPAGGHLQRAQVRRAQRHPRVQGGAAAPGHHQLRHPAGLRRPDLSVPEGPEDAGRRRAARVSRSSPPTRWTSISSGTCCVQGAQIDSFGVGERLITSKSEPVFGGVYKLAAMEDEDGRHHPQDQDQREPRQDHQPPLQEGLPPVRQRHRQGHGRLYLRPRRDGRTTPSPWSSSTRRPPGSARPSPTSPPCSCWCPSSEKGELVYQLPSHRGDPRLLRRARWTRCGTRSSGSRTPTTTTWTCPRPSGTSGRTSSSSINARKSSAASRYNPGAASDLQSRDKNFLKHDRGCQGFRIIM